MLYGVTIYFNNLSFDNKKICYESMRGVPDPGASARSQSYPR